MIKLNHRNAHIQKGWTNSSISHWFCDKHVHTMLVIPDRSPTYCPMCIKNYAERCRNVRRMLKRAA